MSHEKRAAGAGCLGVFDEILPQLCGDFISLKAFFWGPPVIKQPLKQKKALIKSTAGCVLTVFQMSFEKLISIPRHPNT